MLRQARRQVLRRLVFDGSLKCRRVHASSFRAVQSSSIRSRFSSRMRYSNPLSINITRQLSNDSEEPTEEDWERTTRFALDPRASPLGTMSATEIEHAIAAIDYWLAPGNFLPSAYDVMRADKLLQRLVYEHASGTMAVKEYTEALVVTQARVFQTWLSFGSYLMALEHADTILFRMIDWHQRGLIEDVSSRDFQTLAELWLDQNTIDTTEHVADLLLWWTKDPEAAWVSPPEVGPLFHKALQHLTAANDQEAAQSLANRMSELETEWGWEDISPSENEFPAADTVVSNPEKTEDSIDTPDDKKMLSSFELEAMRQKFLEFVNTAGEEDADKVEKFVKRWTSLPNHDETEEDLGTSEIYTNLVDYFIRVKDPKKASKWLQKTDQVASVESGNIPVDRLYSILELWAKSSDREAPWRAQELVHRMEELEAGGVTQMATPTYNLLCEAWLNSSEPVAAQKVLDVVTRMVDDANALAAPDITTCHLLLRMITEHKTVDPAKLFAMVSSIMERRWNNMDEQVELQYLLEKTTDTLCGKGMGQQAERLVRQAIKQEMTVTPSICGNVLKAHAKSRQAVAAVKALDYLETVDKESPHVSLSFNCYEVTLAALVNSGLKGTFEKEHKLLSRLLDRMLMGELDVPPSSDVDRFLTWILYRMRSQRRAFDAHRMLQLMETKLLGENASCEIRIPVDCFNHVLQALSQAGAVDKVEEVFTRLLGYFRLGNDELMPTTKSFSIYLSSVTKDGKRESAEKAEKILAQMIDMYQTTGRAECKPDEGTFNAVFIAWKNIGTKEAVSHSMPLFERMLDLGITPETFTFNTLMATIARSGTDDTYPRVVGLMERMIELDLEPNSHSYNVLLNACASAKNPDRESALNRAVEAMGSVRKIGADMATYPTFLKALRSLLRKDDDRRDKLVGSAFKLCCTDGLLTHSLLDQFRHLLSRDAWESLCDKKMEDSTIPQEWGRNAKRESRR